MIISAEPSAGWYRAKLVLCGAFGVLIGGLLVGAMTLRGPAAPRAAVALGAARYRFALVTNDTDDIAGLIAALEPRVATMKSPFDMAELADLYYRRAQQSGDRKDYALATAMAERSLAIIRTPNPALLTLGKLANARHDFAQAIAIGNELLAHKPTAGAHIVIATAQLALGELPAASGSVNAAIAIKPDSGGYLMRALVMQAQGRDAEATADFARAAELEEPGDLRGAARLRALWSRFAIHRGALADARLLIDEALRVVPGDPLATAQAGELALRSGKPRDAATLFEDAFATSRQVRYLMDEARAEEVAGDRASADALRSQVETIVRAELADNGLGHRLDLVEVLVDRGIALPEAIALGREEIAHRGSAEAHYQLARALARHGDRADARVEIEAALATGAREPQYYELAARLETGPRGRVYAQLAHELDPADAGWRTRGMP